MNRPYSLLSILLSYAPNNEAQRLVSDMYNQMWRDELPSAEIEKQLIIALSDGVQHGNWIWTNISTIND